MSKGKGAVWHQMSIRAFPVSWGIYTTIFFIHCNKSNTQRVFMQKSERVMRIVMSVILPVAMLFLAKEAAIAQTEYLNNGMTREKMCIVVDAGHGGKDPGKVGITGCYEKDINLQIAGKLKGFLEMEGIEVVFTRNDDYGLYSETDSNKKNTDMRNRVQLIEETNPVLTVSIHQNSYSDESIKGAQTFYYSGNAESKKLAGLIQKRLVSTLDKTNHRKEKVNDDYYLLKNTSSPIVIVECGFLSNTEECKALESDYYQEKVAWAIYMGIMQYLNTK